ncbi:MAG: DUF4091 domain-containing protein [Clostridia bacterium]|nr:DUF4091 domain-containing protein [Clostridia bacterium]
MNNIFKRFSAIAMAAAITLPLMTSCANKPKEYPPVELSVEKDLVYGEDVSPFLTSEKKDTVEAYVFSGYEKILSTEQHDGASKNISVYAAKNESESIVASLFANSAEYGLEFKIGTLPEGVSAELFIEKTHLIEEKNWPDPLLPIRIEPVDLDENELQNILIRFNVGKNAVAGDYEIPIVVTNTNGDVFETLNVDLHVWDFTYSDDYALDTAFGIWGTIENYKNYYDFLLDHKISAYGLPYSILSEEAEAYMSDPRVSGFSVGVSEEIYKKLKSNPKWLEKAYTYSIDEPRTKEDLEKLISLYQETKNVMKEVRFLAPFYKNGHYDFHNRIDYIEVFGNNMDIYCAQTTTYNDNFTYSNEFQTRGYKDLYGSLSDRLAKFAEERGGDVWMYACGRPEEPYQNLMVDTNGIDHRLLFWQTYVVGATGFLFWSTTYWNETNDEYTNIDDPWTNVLIGNGTYGDGILMYPGDKYGIDGPCGSVRLEACRDGVEDYELISMLEKALGKEAAMEFVNKVTTAVNKSNLDPMNFNSVRIEMGNALEAALNN